MKSIFYDRRNKREVSGEKLMSINLVVNCLSGDPQDYNMDPEEQPSFHEFKLGTLGYKSEECPSYRNWDLYCKIEDLVFLRFE